MMLAMNYMSCSMAKTWAMQFSVDLILGIVYDSASDEQYPYFFSEETLSSLGFTVDNDTLELARIVSIKRNYKNNVIRGGNKESKIDSI